MEWIAAILIFSFFFLRPDMAWRLWPMLQAVMVTALVVRSRGPAEGPALAAAVPALLYYAARLAFRHR